MRISCDDSQHKKNDDSFISKQYTDSDKLGLQWHHLAGSTSFMLFHQLIGSWNMLSIFCGLLAAFLVSTMPVIRRLDSSQTGVQHPYMVLDAYLYLPM